MPPRRRLRRSAGDIARSFGPLPEITPFPRPGVRRPSPDPVRDIVQDRLSQLRVNNQPQQQSPITSIEPDSRDLNDELERQSGLTNEFKVRLKEKFGEKLSSNEEEILEQSKLEEAQEKGELAAESRLAGEGVLIEQKQKDIRVKRAIEEFREGTQFNKILADTPAEDFDTEELFNQAVNIKDLAQKDAGSRDIDILRRKLLALGASSEDVRRAQVLIEERNESERKAVFQAALDERKERSKILLKRAEENRQADIVNATSQLRINALQFPDLDISTTEGQNQFIATAFELDPGNLEAGIDTLTDEQRIGVINFFDEQGKKVTKQLDRLLTKKETEEQRIIEDQIKAQFPFRNFGSAGNLYTDLVKRMGQDEAIDRFNDLAPLLGIPLIARNSDTDIANGVVNVKDIRSLFEITLPGTTSFNSATQANPNVPNATSIQDDINGFIATNN